MRERVIISFIIISFVLGSVYLFFVSEKHQEPGYRQNWWALYFQNAKSSDVSFVVENYGDCDNFSWEVLAGKEKKAEGEIIVKKGEKKDVATNIDNSENKKITVALSCGGDKKEIYKNISR